MSIKVLVQIWDVPFATAGMKLVALKLADCANEDGENIWPSNHTIERQTQLSRAAVFAHLADLDASGLCVVVERKRKGKAGAKGKGKPRGTIRQFDQDVMNGLASGALRWVQVEVARSNDRARKAWRIVQSLDSNDDAQSPMVGLESPAIGLNESNGRTPYIAEPSFNRHSPAKRARAADRNSDFGEGWATAWTDSARAAVDEIRSSATASHVAAAFLDAVRGVLGPHKGADPAAFVRQVSNRLREFSPAVLADLAEHEISNRSQFLSAAGDLAKIAQALAGKQTALAPAAPAMAAAGDPELVGVWPEIRAGLAHLTSAATANAWLSGVTPLSLDVDRLTLAAPKFIGAYLHANLNDELLAATRRVLPAVKSIRFTTRAA